MGRYRILISYLHGFKAHMLYFLVVAVFFMITLRVRTSSSALVVIVIIVIALSLSVVIRCLVFLKVL